MKRDPYVVCTDTKQDGSRKPEIRVTCMIFCWIPLCLLYREWWIPLVSDALVDHEPCGRVRLHAPDILAGCNDIGEFIRS